MLQILNSILYYLLNVSVHLEPTSRTHIMNINYSITLNIDTHTFLSIRPMIMRKSLLRNYEFKLQ